MSTTEDIELELLLEAVWRKYDYDFRRYSRASLIRRLRQALEHFSCRSFSQLQDRVLHEDAVFRELMRFLTVQVTEMFRDPSYYRALRTQVLPLLQTYPSLKVWIAGCSSGEELYSLAILFREEGLEKRTLFYGTDINRDALERASAGIYDMSRVPAFSEAYQKAGGKASFSDYYTAGYGSMALDKTLRERAVFSDHSIVSDAVFAEVHLISCRNVLIYFDRELQDRAIGLFNEALIRKGFLGIGSKESLQFSAHKEAFSVIDSKERIYQKR